MRYLLPLLPLIIFLINDFFSKNRMNNFMAVFFLLFSFNKIYYESQNFKVKNHVNVLGHQEQELFNYIIDNTDVNCSICFRKPRAIKLFTQRKSTTNCLDENYPVDYIVKSKIYNYPETVNFDNYRLIFENNNYYIYEKINN